MTDLDKNIQALIIENAHRELFDKYYVQDRIKLDQQKITEYKHILDNAPNDWRNTLKILFKKLNRYKNY